MAPYFVDSANSALMGGGGNMTKVEKITADFMEYELPNNRRYDLLLCNQVLEHVHQPALFMRKLINSAETSIISVPFNWGNCGKLCNHVNNNIILETLLGWSAPHKPIHSGIVTEKMNYKFNRRIILVYKTSGTSMSSTTDEEMIAIEGVNAMEKISKRNG